jgi:hypothetical protein
MNIMDSLHLFTSPPWLPKVILPELWAIIFCWKWKLEMKDIHTELIDKVKEYINTNSIIDNPNCGYIINHRKFQGNYWLRYIPDSDLLHGPWEFELVSVNAKCGIELLNWRGREMHRWNMVSCSVFRSNETLYEHLTYNLGIECPKDLDYWAMMKLLRTV